LHYHVLGRQEPIATHEPLQGRDKPVGVEFRDRRARERYHSTERFVPPGLLVQ
jgi:hypothetical protein